MQGVDNSRRSHVSHRAELCLLAGFICLTDLAWAQNLAVPQTLPPMPSQGPATSSTSPADRPGGRYIIAKDDLLDLDVVGAQELSREYRVDADGMITLPMLPRGVAAAGLTLGQLSRAIRKELLDAGLFADPDVTVSVKASPWNSVVLSGAAKKPGVYPVYGHTTLLELLTEAEGLSDDAGRIAIVTRAANALPGSGLNAMPATPKADAVTSRTQKVDVWRLWQNGDESLNLDLYPGDRVMVERAGIVYVLGAVNRAGGFPLSNDEEQMTMLKAIALSGNFAPHAKPAKAVIIRKVSNAPGGRQEIAVNLKKALANQAPDQQLIANDILYVPESGVKKALDGVVSTAVTTTIWRVPF